MAIERPGLITQKVDRASHNSGGTTKPSGMLFQKVEKWLRKRSPRHKKRDILAAPHQIGGNQGEIGGSEEHRGDSFVVNGNGRWNPKSTTPEDDEVAGSIRPRGMILRRHRVHFLNDDGEWGILGRI
jgi:hypothetical protein